MRPGKTWKIRRAVWVAEEQEIKENEFVCSETSSSSQSSDSSSSDIDSHQEQAEESKSNGQNANTILQKPAASMVLDKPIQRKKQQNIELKVKQELGPIEEEKMDAEVSRGDECDNIEREYELMNQRENKQDANLVRKDTI